MTLRRASELDFGEWVSFVLLYHGGATVYKI